MCKRRVLIACIGLSATALCAGVVMPAEPAGATKASVGQRERAFDEPARGARVDMRLLPSEYRIGDARVSDQKYQARLYLEEETDTQALIRTLPSPSQQTPASVSRRARDERGRKEREVLQQIQDRRQQRNLLF